jgi:hypothetical protein
LSTAEFSKVILNLLVVFGVQPAFEDGVKTGLIVLRSGGEVDIGEVKDVLSGVDVASNGEVDILKVEVEIGNGTVVAGLAL